MASSKMRFSVTMKPLIPLLFVSLLSKISAFQSLPFAFRVKLQPYSKSGKRITPLREVEDANLIEDLEIAKDDADGEKESKKDLKTFSARYLSDNDLVIVTDKDGRVTARPASADVANVTARDGSISIALNETEASSLKIKEVEKNRKSDVKQEKSKGVKAEKDKEKSITKRVTKFLKEEVPKPVVSGSFNVVLTHCTADFDSLASAVGLAKLWSNEHPATSKESTEFQSSQNLPTFVVLPRGAHPDVSRFLALHKHLFPIRSLRSLPPDLSGLHRLGLVDAQRRDRVGPAEHLIGFADRVTVVDHHIESDSDIPEATDYVVDKVGSVSAMIAEQLRDSGFELTEAESTLLALGIHADTGTSFRAAWFNLI